MHIVGANGIGGLVARSEPGLGGAISAWYAEVSEAAWSDELHLAGRYPKADFDGTGRVLFDFGPSGHCGIVRVNYGMKIVMIEFIGPRADAPWSSSGARKGGRSA